MTFPIMILTPHITTTTIIIIMDITTTQAIRC
jgi:hypothetical protein